MKNVIEQIRVVKVENGFLINVGEKAFVSLDEAGAATIIEGEIPYLLQELDRKQKEEPTNARPERREIPEAGESRIDNPNTAHARAEG